MVSGGDEDAHDFFVLGSQEWYFWLSAYNLYLCLAAPLPG